MKSEIDHSAPMATLDKRHNVFARPAERQSAGSEPNALRLGILISGRGSNMEALLKQAQKPANSRHSLEKAGAIAGRIAGVGRFFSRGGHGGHKITVATVLSDREDAKGLAIARQYGIDARYIPPGEFRTKLEGACEMEYIEYLMRKEVNLVCLAGFIRVLKSSFLSAFKGRIINIHPSLLPAYPGLNVHKRVLAARETRTGCTVHVVSRGIDTGRILGQKSLDIEPRETSASLSKHVLTLEHKLYREVILKIAAAQDPRYTLPLKD